MWVRVAWVGCVSALVQLTLVTCGAVVIISGRDVYFLLVLIQRTIRDQLYFLIK